MLHLRWHLSPPCRLLFGPYPVLSCRWKVGPLSRGPPTPDDLQQKNDKIYDTWINYTSACRRTNNKVNIHSQPEWMGQRADCGINTDNVCAAIHLAVVVYCYHHIVAHTVHRFTFLIHFSGEYPCREWVPAAVCGILRRYTTSNAMRSTMSQSRAIAFCCCASLQWQQKIRLFNWQKIVVGSRMERATGGSDPPTWNDIYASFFHMLLRFFCVLSRLV